MTKCARCGRKLKAPVVLGGMPFGSTCAQAVAGPRAPVPRGTHRRRAAVAVTTPEADPRQLALSLEVPHDCRMELDSGSDRGGRLRAAGA